MLCLMFMAAYADRTFSFGQISCFCPQTGQTLGGGAVISVTIGDGYIVHSLYGKLYASHTNLDGSTTYLPSGAGIAPAGRLDAILISADLQRLEERITSTMGYMSLNMINTYTNAGEDGGRYASRWAEAESASRRGSAPRYDDHRDSGSCPSCGGTGVSKVANSGGSRTEWVAYYNSSGQECPYCGSYTQHFHDRCASCNVP